MQKFIYKLTQHILKLQVLLHKKRIEHLHKKMTKGSSATLLPEEIKLTLNIEIETKKEKLNNKIKEILKTNQNDPEKLLDFIKEQGTDVFRIENADKFLNFIGEEEGFIPPLNGINALFLNLFINIFIYKKFVLSLKSNEMFVLRPLPIDIYSMIHQLYLWYGFKNDLPGYEIKNRKKYKKIIKTLNNNDIENLSLDEILSMKDAINRDVEAIDFVVNIAKESEATQKLLNKLKDGKSVKL